MRGRISHKEPNDLTPSPFFDKERSTTFFEKSSKPFFQPAIQPKLKVNQSGDVYEQEADAMAGNVMNRLSGPSTSGSAANHNGNESSQNNLSIQRKCANCDAEQEMKSKKELSVQRQVNEIGSSASDGEAMAESPLSETGFTEATPGSPDTASGGATGKFLVDDSGIPSPTQMRKSDFLASLKQEVIDGTGMFSSTISGGIQTAFLKYQGNTAAQLEEMIQQQAPSAMQAQNAVELVQLVKAKVISEIQLKVPGLGAVGDAAQTIGDAVGDVVSGVGSAIGDAVSGIGSLFFKANSGGGHVTQSPSGVMQSLGKGQMLDSRSQSKMESAFGTSFSDVEMHTDANAAQLSGGMNAKAFTVGNHVAFGKGEYRPGTLIGDTLLAHELAHVIQQRGVDTSGDSGPAYGNLEEDADAAAATAMVGQYGEAGTVETRKPKNKTGLKIQRCGPSSPKGAGGKDAGTPSPTPPATPAPAGSPRPTTSLTKPGDLGTEVAGATRTKWRVDFKTKKEAENQRDNVRRKGVKADDPEATGKMWTFYYYPLTEAEATAAQVGKQKELGDKYKVEVKNDSTVIKSYYLEISLKCPEAIPVKSGFEVWETCYPAEKDATTQVKKFTDAKLAAEVYKLDESMYGVYFKPYKTEADAKTAGEAEAAKRGGAAEGMFTTTASYNAGLKSFVYSTSVACPAGYTDIGSFHVTSYALAQESEFAKTPTVKNPCGLTGTFRKKFLYETAAAPRGVKMQGSGQALSGKFIHYKGGDCFEEVANPITANGSVATSGRTVAVDKAEVPLGTNLLIEDVGPRVAEDTGGRIKGKDIDVYFGTDMTIMEATANTIGEKKVCKKK